MHVQTCQIKQNVILFGQILNPKTSSFWDGGSTNLVHISFCLVEAIFKGRVPANLFEEKGVYRTITKKEIEKGRCYGGQG
jgi:hypothetical protein